MNSQFEKNLLLLERLGTHREEKKIDDSNILQLPSMSHNLVYCYLYSDIINFFEKNKEENIPLENNNWSNFLEKDETMIFSLIIYTKVDAIIEKVTSVFNELLKGKEEKKNIKLIVDYATDILFLLNYWLKNTRENSFLRKSIEKFIVSNLHPVLELIFHLDKINKIKLPFIKDFDVLKSVIDKLSKENFLWKINNLKITKNNDDNEKIETDNLFVHSISNLIFMIVGFIEDIKGDVKNSFDESINSGEHKPHMGLLLCFLKLVEEANEQLNNIPNRLQNYYYKEILKMKPLEIKPDSTHVNFQIKNNSKAINLDKGTKIFGGKNEKGDDIIFESESKCYISDSKLQKVFILKNDINARFDKKKKINDSIEIEEYSGHSISAKEPLGENKKIEYKTGIVIENKIFSLDSGDRYIYIKFNLTKEGFSKTLDTIQGLKTKNVIVGEIRKIINDSLIIEYSTQTNWQPVNTWSASTSDDEKNTITIALFIDRTKPAIDFSNKINREKESYDISSPSIRLTLNTNNYIENVSVFEFFNIEKICIEVSVENYRNITLQDDYGNIDFKKSFRPFGATPKLNSALYVNCNNILAIQPSQVSMNIKWADLPEGNNGFENYYKGYSQYVKNDDFKIRAELMYNEQWMQVSNKPINLFETKLNENNCAKLLPEKIISLELKSILNTDDGLNFLSKKNNTGAIRLSLISPNIAFGHSDYNEITKKNIIDSVKHKIKNEKNDLNHPYTPIINSISLNYTASTSIVFNKKIISKDFYDCDVKHILPFGYWSYLFNENKSTEISLFTKGSHLGSVFYENALDIYLGFEKSMASILSIHVEIEHASNIQINSLMPLQVQIIEKNIWITTSYVKIISDSTMSFTKSGVIQLQVNKGIEEKNTLMKDKLFWIRIYSPNKNFPKVPKIHGVYMNGIKVTRYIKNKDEEIQIIQPGTLSKLHNKNIPEIISINQPFCSSGSYPKESEENFCKRARNRISHKNRPLSILDYEKIILENFEEIMLVKCINNCSKREYTTNAPGYITIVVVPNKKTEKCNSLMLSDIKNFLQKIISPHIKVEVTNPIYEKVKVFADIKLKDNFSLEHTISDLKESFLKKLKFDIKDENENIRLTTALYPSNLYRSILNRDEVEYVNNFRLIKYYEVNEKKYLQNIRSLEEKVLPTLPWAFLTSAEEHVISLSSEDPLLGKERDIGIGSMSIEKDFTIGPWESSTKKNVTIDNNKLQKTFLENFITFKIKT